MDSKNFNPAKVYRAVLTLRVREILNLERDYNKLHELAQSKRLDIQRELGIGSEEFYRIFSKCKIKDGK